MKPIILFIFLLLFSLSSVGSQLYQADWQSLTKHPIPTCWTGAKFDFFIHWSPCPLSTYAPVDEMEVVYEKYSALGKSYPEQEYLFTTSYKTQFG